MSDMFDDDEMVDLHNTGIPSYAVYGSTVKP